MRTFKLHTIEQEYEQLANDYDERWRRYILATISESLKRLPSQSRPDCLLDVGCGTGVMLEALSYRFPGASLFGVDPSSAMLEKAQERLKGAAQLVQSPAEELPFSEGKFDGVVSLSSLHYWSNWSKGMGEIYRVLKPGGYALISDWDSGFWGNRLRVWFLQILRRPLGSVLNQKQLTEGLTEIGFYDIEGQTYKVSPLWGMMTIVAFKPNE